MLVSRHMAALNPSLPLALLAPHTKFEMVAFGGSAGGIPALRDVLSRLPSDFPIPIVVVQHLGANEPSRLPEVLGFSTTLRCRWAAHGDRPRPGFVHIAPPGGDLTLTATGELCITRGPRRRMGSPSVDSFLDSVALHLGSRAISVVLSGMMHDGAKGTSAVRRSGGATMTQHPRTAICDEMPSAAFDFGRADLMLSLPAIARALEILAAAGVV